MPFYEYKCTNCGEVFEDMHSMNAPPLTVCKLCGKEGVKKLIATPKIQYNEPWQPLGKRLR